MGDPQTSDARPGENGGRHHGKPPGRVAALAGFISVAVAYLVGLAGFFVALGLPGSTKEEMLQQSRVMNWSGTFAILCDLMAIVLGAKSLPKPPGVWRWARGFGIAALSAGIVGVIGALLLFLLASMIKDCANCNCSAKDIGPWPNIP